MRSPLVRFLAVAALSLPAACHTRDPKPAAAGTAVAVAPAPAPTADEPLPPAGPPAPPEGPAAVDHVAVDGDLPATIVRGRGGVPPRILFFPGVCSNATGYLSAFPEAARAHGGVIAIDGDQPCGAPNSGFRSFSWDPIRADARFRAALAAAGVTDVPPGGYTLVGYSAGADIGQLMVQRWPERYPRVVLIGAPSDPDTARLSHAEAVVTMSCSHDVPLRLKDAARRVRHAGIPSEYLEMPGCPHGYVTDGEHLFGEAFDFLDANGHSPG
jgi:hypothetical protein